MNARVLRRAVLAATWAGAVAARADPLAQCDALAASRPAAWATSRCYSTTARSHKLIAEGCRRLERLLAEHPQAHWARFTLGSLRDDRGDPSAERLYLEAADGFRSAHDAAGEVLVRMSLVQFLQQHDRLAEAPAQIAQARAVAAASNDRLLQARVTTSEAWQAYRDGDPGRAQRLLRACEHDVFPKSWPELQSGWLSALGAASWALGRHEQALRAYERQAEMLREAGDRYEEAVARGNVVFLAEVLGWPAAERRVLASELLATSIAAGNRGTLGRAHLYLARVSRGSEAIEHARLFVAVARETQRDVPLALRTLSNALSGVDAAAALRLNDEAVRLAQASADRQELARALITRAELRWTSGPHASAVQTSTAALDAIEATRDLQKDELSRARRFSQWGGVYVRFAAHLLRGDLRPSGAAVPPEDVALAFALSERRRARVLLDEMDAAHAGVGHGAGPAAQGRAAILDQMALVQRRLLDPALPATRRSATLADLERLERAEEEARAEVARSDPGFAALRRPRLASLAEVQETLDEDEALLAFQCGARGGEGADSHGSDWLFVVTRAETRVYPLPGDLAQRVALFVGLFERSDDAEAQGAARLYQDLLAPALGDLPPQARRLVIVPDGPLHRLPFDALRPVPDGQPLAASYEIALSPSATVWLRLRQAAVRASSAPALALADPVVLGATGATAQRAWALEAGGRLGRLPYARREGRALVDVLGGDSRMLSGGEASEHALKSIDLQRFAVLHIAAHALVDDGKPERSAILLAPGESGDDGLLQIREVLGLDLRGRVVVLSACRSADGEVVRGEGPLGLGRAFMQAGARAVVASLWPLRDEEAPRLFEAFYRELAAGRSVARALAEAKRERLHAGARSSAWAGVVVFGDGDVVPFPEGRPRQRPFWPLGVVLALALPIAVYGARRLRH